MKRYYNILTILVILIMATEVESAPPLFKQKKYFGPIPFNTLSLSIGFIDGPSAEHLTDNLDDWAFKRGKGYDIFDAISTSFFSRLGFERQLTPNHFLRSSLCLSYLKTSSLGWYIAQSEPPFELDIERTFRVYLVSLELGFAYCLITPEVRRVIPYAGGGFAAVIPFTKLTTDSFLNDGSPYSNPGETISKNSLEAGMHVEFGMNYYITNRYSAGIEGRYQMAQSKFNIHGGNFDIDYAGLSLSLNLNYHF